MTVHNKDDVVYISFFKLNFEQQKEIEYWIESNLKWYRYKIIDPEAFVDGVWVRKFDGTALKLKFWVIGESKFK